ncbi:MAG: O-antigen ligase family protein [Candidatus Saccharimonadales bacterium]
MTRALANIIIVFAALVLFGVLFQAPISVLADVHAPGAALLLKAWKEILLGTIGVLLIVLIWRTGTTKQLLRDKLLWLVGAIGVLHIVLLFAFDNHYVSEAAGLLIDVRTYLFFAELYVLVRIWPPAKRPLLLTFGAGAGIVLLFAVLQATVLPRDILASIGYSDETIKPYLTVDLNPDYVRISSTLRGPNPLGALAVITLSFAVVKLLQCVARKKYDYRYIALLLCGALASGVALWYSYSRSALLGAAVAMAVIAVAWAAKKLPVKLLFASFAALIVLTGGALYITKDTSFVQNVVFHSNPDGGSEHKSDHGHAESLAEGVEAAANQPFGAGIGGVGSASLLTDEPLIIENQYLYIAHESGWVGLALQLWLFGWLLLLLWRDRQHTLSLGLVASGLGMAVIGLVLPVWADDTIGLIWWGLAGITAATIVRSSGKTPQKRTSVSTLKK